MGSHPLIELIAIGLVLAFIFGMIAQRLHIPPIVGYLIAGVVIAPTTPGIVADANEANQIAEMGVILLMFGVGLHFSFKDLMEVKYIAVPGAIVQIGVATLLGWGLSSFLGWGTMSGILFGLCLSTASTVVLLRALEERQLITTYKGKIAIGWLIVEDLMMVLALVLLPIYFATQNNSGDMDAGQIFYNILITLSKVAAFILIMIFGGSRLIPWLLARSAATGSREIFTLAVLAIAMGIAFGAVTLFQVSFALGAFFAGVVLNESELSHRAAHDTLPLRDAFAVLFFVSVGMLFDPRVLVDNTLLVVATVAIIVFGKSIAAYAIVKMMRHTQRTALLISASLAQIGEFAFILAALGQKHLVFNETMYNLVVAGAIFSILLNPAVFALIQIYVKRAERIEDVNAENSVTEQIIELDEEINSCPLPMDLHDHIILIGYGRVGKSILQQLAPTNIPVVVVDNSLPCIESLQENGNSAIFGNAANHEILLRARLDTARSLLVTTNNGYEAAEIVAFAREQRPLLPIVVRAHFDDEIEYLAERGATNVILGEQELAFSMITALQLDETSKEELPHPAESIITTSS